MIKLNQFVRGISIFFWLTILLYATWLLALLSVPYLQVESGIEFLQTKQLIYHIDLWRWSFYTHVFSSVFVLLAGIPQFIPSLIAKKSFHRISGFLYFSILLLLAGPSGMVMSFYANGGSIAQFGFVSLSILWLLTTLLSLYHLKQTSYLLHAQWITRSYALTLAAITLRFYGFLFDYFKLDFHPVDTYRFLAFASWVPNLILAEILIQFGLIQNLLSSKN